MDETISNKEIDSAQVVETGSMKAQGKRKVKVSHFNRRQISRRVLWVVIVVLTGVLIALVVVPRVLSAFQSGDNNAVYDALIVEADLLYIEYEYSDALKKYVAASDSNPYGFKAYVGMLTVLVDKNLFTQADEIMQIASVKVSDKTQLAQLHLIIANRYYELEMYDSALQRYKDAYEVDTGNGEAQIGVVRSSLQRGDIKDLQKYLEIDSADKHFYESRLLLAYTALSDASKVKAAIQPLEHMRCDDQGLTGRYNDLDKVVTKSAEYEEDELYCATMFAQVYIDAQYPFLGLLVLDPYLDDMREYPDGLYLLGRSYYESGQYKTAIKHLTAAVVLGDNLPNLYLFIARSYSGNGDVDQMIQFYDRAIAESVENQKLDIMREYANVLLEHAFYNKCEFVLNDLSQYVDDEWLSFLYVKLYCETEQYNKMLSRINKIGNTVSVLTLEDKRVYYDYYIMYALKQGDDELVAGLLEKFMEIDKYNHRVHFLYGEYWVSQGNAGEARKSLETAIELDREGDTAGKALKLLAID